MKHFKINSTDIILQNYNKGEGKIIISDLYNGSYSYYWNSMGSDIETFLQRIDSGYFASKLCNKIWVFSGKDTLKKIRTYIRTELTYELPWYKFMSAQKELRDKLKELEDIDNQYEALAFMQNLHKNLYCFDLDNHETREFKSIIESMFDTEPWFFLGEELSQEHKFLTSIHKEIKNHLRKEIK